MEPPPDVQQQLNASGDNLQNLAGELRLAELDAQKKPLVDSFYKEVSHTYGLRPEGRMDYSQFAMDGDGKTLYLISGLSGSVGCAIRLEIRRSRVQPPAEVGNILSWRLIMKYFLVILSLPLIQEGQLSVSGKRMCTILVNHLED